MIYATLGVRTLEEASHPNNYSLGFCFKNSICAFSPLGVTLGGLPDFQPSHIGSCVI